MGRAQTTTMSTLRITRCSPPKWRKDYARLRKLWVIVDEAGIWQSRPDSKVETMHRLRLYNETNETMKPAHPPKPKPSIRQKLVAKRTVAALRARRLVIEATLNSGTYAGYGMSPALKMGWVEFNQFCTGQLILAIGRGAFADEVTSVIRLSMAWNEYHERRKQLIAEHGLRSEELPI